MKDVYELLREKESDVSRLRKEVEALRVTAPLLTEGETEDDNQATRASAAAKELLEDFQAKDTPREARPAWGDRAKNWLGRQAPDSGRNQ